MKIEVNPLDPRIYSDKKSSSDDRMLTCKVYINRVLKGNKSHHCSIVYYNDYFVLILSLNNMYYTVKLNDESQFGVSRAE